MYLLINLYHKDKQEDIEQKIMINRRISNWKLCK